jgi:hypothetical protein
VLHENFPRNFHPLRKNTPESAEAFAEKAYALMPRVKITELLAEVDQWTSLGDRFLHLRTQAPPKNRQALLTAVLADGINLGLTRCPRPVARREAASWTADWHVREECYAQALRADRAASPAPWRLTGARHHFILGRSVLSRRRSRRPGLVNSITVRPCVKFTPSIRSIWAVSHQGDQRDR